MVNRMSYTYFTPPVPHPSPPASPHPPTPPTHPVSPASPSVSEGHMSTLTSLPPGTDRPGTPSEDTDVGSCSYKSIQSSLMMTLHMTVPVLVPVPIHPSLSARRRRRKRILLMNGAVVVVVPVPEDQVPVFAPMVMDEAVVLSAMIQCYLP